MTARRAVMLDAGATGPRAREGALAGALEARGFAVERASDPRVAFESVAREAADVLVVDADSPSLDLREFVERIRNDPRTARTLIVALLSGDPRELPARREIALTLAKPINADDAASRLDGLVVTRQRAAAGARELRGDLAQLPLPDLLQLLSVSRASGTLAIDATERRGSLVLADGDLREISCGPATGLKALVRLLMLTEGAFVFTHGALGSASAGGEVLGLGPALFEATRQLDEMARLRPSLPDPWIEVRRARAADANALPDGSAAVLEVARLLEAPRTLGALLDASALPDADVLQALDALRRAGLVEVAGSASDRVEVLGSAHAATLAARAAEQGRALARVLVLVDPTPSATDIAMMRVLGGIAGFTPAEGALAAAIPLGTLGTLTIQGVRVELFAVPTEWELSPLWAVFGASADAAIVAAPLHGDGREQQLLASEVGIPVARVEGALSARAVADALRGVLEQLAPRR